MTIVSFLLDADDMVMDLYAMVGVCCTTLSINTCPSSQLSEHAINHGFDFEDLTSRLVKVLRFIS